MTLGTIFDFFKFFFFNLGKEATNTLITIASSFLMVLVGSIISRKSSRDAIAASNKNAIDLMRRQELNRAVAKFRAAFAPTLAIIYLARHHGTHDRPDDDKFIKDHLLLHATAVEEFRIFVPTNNMGEYQQAWEEYRKAARDDIYMRTAEEWATAAEESCDVPYGKIIEDKIHKVLRFAEQK